ncbi:MAG: hypothetical protein ACE362_07120 [Phaeodactylibacter xiamenensis]|uniref:N-acetyltransferase domain-containing protein n=1 Tax=Phaeodactylibacter xiamenensis TaxID=1524460 RepID=A0A098SDI7_9BACT|nr:hypothetical protein [Phaeodactylibacter xiamenensis]KGE89698.1 hypothetical protein IX84_01300 [Phaeodactylibacter xiamenensis]MCR9055332.1 hypothetical protein [bacterium]
MKVRHKSSGELIEARVEPVEGKDWANIEKNNAFQFDWTLEKRHETYKVRLDSDEEILGLISFKDIPGEFRIHICLIEVNRRDVGRKKRYDHLAGCLLAFACEQSFKRDYEGYVSLRPKTELIGHYVSKYGFRQLGKNLFVELADAERLINEYLNNGR